eukprot:9170861-Pyramimonas_sp.AAC.1
MRGFLFRVISEHLVEFGSIQELQQQNQKLLAVTHQLAEDRETVSAVLKPPRPDPKPADRRKYVMRTSVPTGGGRELRAPLRCSSLRRVAANCMRK